MSFYIVATDEKKQRIKAITGPYTSEREAQEVADDVEGETEIVSLSTVDLSAATRKIKHIFFRRTKDLDRSMRKVGHKVA